MTEIKLMVERQRAVRSDDQEAIESFHLQRAELIHGLVDELNLDVRDWGDTDATRPCEAVEIIVALGSAGVFTAMVSAFKALLDQRRIETIKIESPKGKVTLRHASVADAQEIIRTLGLELSE